MAKVGLILALLFGGLLGMNAGLALAQQGQTQDPHMLQAGLGALQQQRNAAMDALAGVQAQLQVANEQIAALKQQVEDAKKDVSAPHPQDH